MKQESYNNLFRKLVVNLFMLILFILLSSFSIWIIWMYFFRGPIPMESRGYVSSTLREKAVQPADTERYTLQHFHNLDEIVLKGIEYPSTCVSCHGDYPHSKTPKVRAFFNAHAWFIACEVCHRDSSNDDTIIYRWLDNDTDIALYKLPDLPSMYAARIVPYMKTRGTEQRLDGLIDTDTLEDYNLAMESMSETQKKSAIKTLHQGLTEKPVSCENCHTSDGLLDFNDLLYSDHMTMHLKSIDVGLMIKGYEVFYFPDVDRKLKPEHQ